MVSGKNIVEARSWRTSRQRQAAEHTGEEEEDLFRRRSQARFRWTGDSDYSRSSWRASSSEEKRAEEALERPTSSPTSNQDGEHLGGGDDALSDGRASPPSSPSSPSPEEEETKEEDGLARRTSPTLDEGGLDETPAADAAAVRLSSPEVRQTEEAPVPNSPPSQGWELVEPSSGATAGRAVSPEGGGAIEEALAGHSSSPPTQDEEPGGPKGGAPSAGRDFSSPGGGHTEGAAARGSPPTRGGQPSEERDAGAAGLRSSSAEEERDASEHSFRAQVASFVALDELTRENHEALKGLKRLLQSSAAGGRFPPAVADPPDADKLRELDRLVALAKALDEVAVSLRWWYKCRFPSVVATLG